MSAGREFQTVGAATRKLRAPKFNLYDGKVNKLDWLERKLRPGTVIKQTPQIEWSTVIVSTEN